MRALFIIGAVAGGALALLLLLTVRSTRFSIWPVPMGAGLRSLVFWGLFRCFHAAALLYLAFQGWGLSGQGGPAVSLVRYTGAFVGVLCALLFVVAGLRLGRDALYGRGEGLETAGLYRFSRKPQYTAAIIGYAGAALFAWSPAGVVLAGLAIVVFLLMARAEEPWLAVRYGTEYERYSSRVPRFFGLGTLLALGEAWSWPPAAFRQRGRNNRSARGSSPAPGLSRRSILDRNFAGIRARVRSQARSGR